MARGQGIQIVCTINPAQWAEAKRRLSAVQGGVERAAVSALNRTAMGIRTDATRMATDRYTVKSSVARASLSVSKASRGNLLAMVRSSGTSIPLHAFQVSPRRTSGKRPGGGLRVSVKKGSGGQLKSGFMVANLKVGGGLGRATGVAQRLGASRYPIRPLYGPSVPSMLSQEEQLEPLQGQAAGRLQKAMAHEIERLVAGYGK